MKVLKTERADYLKHKIMWQNHGLDLIYYMDILKNSNKNKNFNIWDFNKNLCLALIKFQKLQMSNNNFFKTN